MIINYIICFGHITRLKRLSVLYIYIIIDITMQTLILVVKKSSFYNKELI